MSTFPALWQSLLPIGRDPATGGYRRFCWSPAELDCRAWFETTAAERNLRPVTDRNGNLWAWWEPPEPQRARPAAIAVGSHLDSVPDGGAFDGPLGVVSAFAAVDELRATGFVPARPIAVAAFAEEEGGRFGVACLGSRLLTGAIDPEQARGLTDGDGTTFGAAMQAAGHDPGGLGRDEELIGRLGTLRGTAHRAGPGAWPTSMPSSVWPTRSGRTAGGGSTSPGRPTTQAPRPWPTGTTR